MAIGPIGNTIFTNQMTPSASSVQNAHNNRIELQNMAAQAVVQERDEKVLEVRPAEQSHELNPDREHQRDESQRENERDNKHQENEEENDNAVVFKLDIKV